MRKRLEAAALKWRWYLDSDRGLAALLVLLVFYTFIVYPLLGGEMFRSGAPSIFFSLILIAGIVATATHHAVRAGILATAVIAFTSHWANFIIGGRLDHMIATTAAGVFFSLQMWFLSRRVFGDGEVNIYRILGAVCVYLVIGLLWANVFLLIYLARPEAFHFAPGTLAYEPPTSDMLYFSFVTLTTVGYGDITPVGPLVKSMATLEALIGQLYPAIVLGRLVTQYQGRPKKG